MTLQEILKSQGLTPEQIESVASEMKQNKIFTSNEENLDVRYGKLKGEHDSKLEELTKANSLIEELKKSTKGNEGLQSKIAEYETQIKTLNEQLEQTKLENEIKVALLENKATDIDYLTFKLKEKGELKLGEDGKIKGMDDMLAGLKIQFPNQFESTSSKKIEENKLDKGEDRGTVSKEAFEKMGYLERVNLKNNDPDTYDLLTGKNTK